MGYLSIKTWSRKRIPPYDDAESVGDFTIEILAGKWTWPDILTQSMVFKSDDYAEFKAARSDQREPKYRGR